ncbi:unnamed protein product [Amoebophrya sp. A25]|nr:unnamed protein product [Amoebophrya sp. A25]|eukprot:GSA25T00019730001.1
MGSPTSSGGGNGDGSSSCKMMIDHDHDDEHVEDGLHSAASARHDGITTAVGGGDFSGNELTNDHSQTCSVVSALQERSGCRPRAGSFSKRSSLPCEKQQQDQVTRVKQSYMAQLTALTNEYRATNSEVAQIECELALLTDEQPKSAVGDDEGASAASSRPPSSGGARRRAGSISSTTTTQKGGTRTSVGRLGVHRDRLMEKRRYIREQLSIAYRDWRKGRRTLLDKAKKDTQLAEARRFAQFEHEVDSLRRQVNAIHVRSKKMTKTMSRGRRGGEQGQCETTDTCATEEVSTFFAKELPQKVREWEQEGAAKLQRLEQKIAAHDRRREQERTNVEVQREQEMRELVAYRRENAVHAARKRLRDQMEAAKAAERARLREQQQEQEEEAARRMERTLEKLKVAAPEDPERLFRMCTSGVPRYFDPKGTICRNQVADVHGYFEERLQRDPRYRLSAALHKADMIQSDAARSALQSVRPVLAKNHALNSAVPGMPLGV